MPCDRCGRSVLEDNADITKRHLSGSRGIIVEAAITIYRPVSEVYTYWRNLENLPRFMDHLIEVPRSIGFTRAGWREDRWASASSGTPK